MYYFWGAGNNCYGAIKYFGAENVVAIVDMDSRKIGTIFNGVPVISFEQMMKDRKDETIVITVFMYSHEVVKQLTECGIQDYFVAPLFNGNVMDAETLIDKLELHKYKTVGFYKMNPLLERIRQQLKARNSDICFLLETDVNMSHLEENVEILLVDGMSEEIEQIQCVFPNMSIVDIQKINSINNQEQYRHLSKYKNKHLGESCFVIGTGPSLKVSDLERIGKENIVSFASNKLYLLYDKTEWRPDYYVIVDRRIFDESENYMSDILSSDTFVRKFDDMDKVEGVNWFAGVGENFYPGFPSFSSDIVEGVFGSRTVTYDILQIAAYMGFKKIYLIGIDFTWGENEASTHFCDNYTDDTLVRYAEQLKEQVEHGYIAAREYAKQHGIKIYNATRGGKLEVFERVELDELFEESKVNDM